MTDADAIARFIAERGVTQCPVAFLWSSQASVESAGRIGNEDRGKTRLQRQMAARHGGASHRSMARLRERARR